MICDWSLVAVYDLWLTTCCCVSSVTDQLCVLNPQIEDLNQQAQVAAANKFKAFDSAGATGEQVSTVSQPIQEESEEEDEEVCVLFL